MKCCMLCGFKKCITNEPIPATYMCTELYCQIGSLLFCLSPLTACHNVMCIMCHSWWQFLPYHTMVRWCIIHVRLISGNVTLNQTAALEQCWTPWGRVTPSCRPLEPVIAFHSTQDGRATDCCFTLTRSSVWCTDGLDCLRWWWWGDDWFPVNRAEWLATSYLLSTVIVLQSCSGYQCQLLNTEFMKLKL